MPPCSAGGGGGETFSIVPTVRSVPLSLALSRPVGTGWGISCLVISCLGPCNARGGGGVSMPTDHLGPFLTGAINLRKISVGNLGPAMGTRSQEGKGCRTGPPAYVAWLPNS
jgi:hypothetical protein